MLFDQENNGLGSSQTLSTGKGGRSCRSKAVTTVAAVLFFFKLSLAVIVAVAVSGSLYWTITTSISRNQTESFHQGYHRKLEEQVITDLFKILDLSSVSLESKVVQSCPPDYQDYVPFYQKKKNCLVAPPRNYRIPLRWPTGKDFIWKENVKMNGREFSSGSLTKRMMVEEEQISFHSDSLMVDGVEDYSHQIAETIGLDDSDDWNRGGIRNVLDIGCGFGSLGAHLFSKQLLTTCIADYEESGSQVQITLERGLPAIIASFGSVKLPFPSLSFDMLHCRRCGIVWDDKPAAGGTLLLEVDRLLKPGGYFVLTSNTSGRLPVAAEDLCWRMLSQPTDETIVWKKPTNVDCYGSRKSGPKICEREEERDLQRCITGTKSRRWVPIESSLPWPSRAKPVNSTELNKLYGLRMENLVEDGVKWDLSVKNYWSLLSPLIFSDHPKRPGDEEPPPPSNMVRNVLDMNAGYGGFNTAMLDAGKDVWVMNVVPPTAPNSDNHLPLILDRGFVGVQHHWCQPFPTYPRTYDMVHGDGILTLTVTDKCSNTMLDLLIEVDRILRPQGWVILHDKADLIEAARYTVTSQLRWEARLVVPDVKTGDELLICQKTFVVDE